MDDDAYSQANWTKIGSQSYFSKDCSLGIQDNTNNFSNLSVYPNPTHGNFAIDLGKIKTELYIILSNNMGQVLFNRYFESASIVHFNLETPAGIYFLRVASLNGEQKVLKVVIE